MKKKKKKPACGISSIFYPGRLSDGLSCVMLDIPAALVYAQLPSDAGSGDW